MKSYLDPLFESIFPIIFYDENDLVNVAGTSTLVEHKGQNYLLTAAHVLKNPGRKYHLYILLRDKAVHLHEPAFMSKIQKTDIDTAFFPLAFHPTLETHLSGYKSITLKEYDGDIAYSREHYFVFGFPWRRAKYNRTDKELNARPLQYFTDLIDDSSLFSKYNRPQESHILVQYNPKTTINRSSVKQLAPHPHGISGGPLFKALINDKDELILLIFEGLLIEWKDSRVIVATKKEKIRNFIDGKP